MSDEEAKNCFGCHSTSGVTDNRINFERVTPGIRCETCHGPGGSHATAIKAGQQGKNLIFNPSRLSGDELSQEFCSACHRVIDDFEKLRSLQINNVRFQPYRIFKSKCYSDDRRIRCIACHDPHETVIKDSAYYDQKCLACHSVKSTGTAKPAVQDPVVTCKVSTKNCVSCHMQDEAPPQAHFKFTDHYIRVIRSGEEYPD
jgi:Zn finger protein HypA/HybF involved in hydrogenase expression